MAEHERVAVEIAGAVVLTLIADGVYRRTLSANTKLIARTLWRLDAITTSGLVLHTEETIVAVKLIITFGAIRARSALLTVFAGTGLGKPRTEELG